MNIDEKLLDRVKALTGAKTRTQAVDLALREFDRRESLGAVLRRGLGLTPDELKTMVDPGYDLEAMRAAESPEHYEATRNRPS